MKSFSTPQPKKPAPICPICNLAVFLESAKTDEHGRAIHEDCYLLSLKLKHQTASPRTHPKP